MDWRRNNRKTTALFLNFLFKPAAMWLPAFLVLTLKALPFPRISLEL